MRHVPNDVRHWVHFQRHAAGPRVPRARQLLQSLRLNVPSEQQHEQGLSTQRHATRCSAHSRRLHTFAKSAICSWRISKNLEHDASSWSGVFNSAGRQLFEVGSLGVIHLAMLHTPASAMQRGSI